MGVHRPYMFLGLYTIFLMGTTLPVHRRSLPICRTIHYDLRRSTVFPSQFSLLLISSLPVHSPSTVSYVLLHRWLDLFHPRKRSLLLNSFLVHLLLV